MNDKQTYASVKAGFTLQQTSLHQWCNANGINRQNARDALMGIWKGRKGLELRQLLIKESGAQVYNLDDKVVNQSCKPETQVYNS